MQSVDENGFFTCLLSGRYDIAADERHLASMKKIYFPLTSVSQARSQASFVLPYPYHPPTLEAF